MRCPGEYYSSRLPSMHFALLANNHWVTAPTPTASFLEAQAIFRAKSFHVQYRTFSTPVTIDAFSPMKMEQIGCSEMLTFKLPTPSNNPEESIRQDGDCLVYDRMA
jgi:hypothetical protein